MTLVPFFLLRILTLLLYTHVYIVFTFLKLHWLCYYSFNFPLLPPSMQQPHSLRQTWYHCSCPWVMCISPLATPFPILCFTSPWLFCNYLFVLLNPLTSSPISLQSPPIWQTSKSLCIHESVSVLLVCLVSFLDSIVDRFVFFAILLFIVSIFFFLNMSL